MEDTRAHPLREEDLDPDPARQFEAWFFEARKTERLPEAAALATATPDGMPSVRMVLVKELGEEGLVFYTGYASRKGQELAANPRAALCFYWDAPGRQVRVEGPVAVIAESDSDGYFATRPLGARLSAAASRQSEVVGSREELEAAVAALVEAGIPERPDYWGGYRLVPEAWEFWQHREDRLHDRFRYRRDAVGWTVERLYP